MTILLTDEEVNIEVYKTMAAIGLSDIAKKGITRDSIAVKAQAKKILEMIEGKIKDYEPRLSKHVKSTRLIRDLSLKNDIVIAQLELKGEIICLKELRQTLKKEVELN